MLVSLIFSVWKQLYNEEMMSYKGSKIKDRKIKDDKSARVCLTNHCNNFENATDMQHFLKIRSRR